MPAPDPSGVVVAVAPTSTVVASVDARVDEWVTVQVQNMDATQTFTGYVERRVSSLAEWSLSTIGDLNSIPPAGSVDAAGNPTDSVTVDLDVSATGYLRVVGTMSGAGGNVTVYVRKGPRK